MCNQNKKTKWNSYEIKGWTNTDNMNTTRNKMIERIRTIECAYGTITTIDE